MKQMIIFILLFLLGLGIAHADSDGIDDTIDKCPDTETGVMVNEDGCSHNQWCDSGACDDNDECTDDMCVEYFECFHFNICCEDGGKQECTINEKKGKQVCENGEWGPCKITPWKYIIIFIISITISITALIFLIKLKQKK